MLVRAASYIERMLRGAAPADLPTHVEMVINMKTAKALAAARRPGGVE